MNQQERPGESGPLGGESLDLPDSQARILRAQRVDAICLAFEEAWRQGKDPAIEAFLAGEDQDREALLGELIPLEIELRRRRGESVGIEEYRQRFPDDRVEIRGDFDQTEWYRTTAPLPAPAPKEGPEPIESDEPRAGDVLGDYRLLEHVAAGGMGVVYRAWQQSLRREVAVKLIRSGSYASHEEQKRFQTEAEAAARLDHPGIMPIYQVGRHGGHDYYSMKLVRGGSLASRHAEYRGDFQRIAVLLRDIARAVGSAHEKGVIHRDLKPSNILLDEGNRPLVADFGLAKDRLGASLQTAPGAVLGTPAYMAPEQAIGAEAREASDIYSLGAILYELLTGQPPFRGRSVPETLSFLLGEEAVPPRRLCRAVPAELELVCLKCLEKSPGQRYPTAVALADDLDRYLRGEPISASRGGSLKRVLRWSRREPELAARLAGQLAVLFFTQVNNFIYPNPDLVEHQRVTGVELTWVFSTLAFHGLSLALGKRQWIRPVWITLDVGLLTLVLYVLDAVGSSLVAGYPLLIVASGLWNHVGLVWLTMGLSLLGYCLLALEANQSGSALLLENHDPNVLIAVLMLMGFVTAHIVRRLDRIEGRASGSRF